MGLQYLRALAAISVVIGHASGSMGEAKYGGVSPFHDWLTGCAAGVYVFFCLSGFIIVYISLDRELNPITTMAAFARRRFDRIIPYMWLAILAYAVLRLGTRGVAPWGGYARALTLFPVGEVEPKTIWTLRYEAVFYAVFAPLCLGAVRWRGVLGLWILSPIVLMLSGPSYAGPLGGWREAVGLLLGPVNLLFGAGMGLGVAFLKLEGRWPRVPALVLPILMLIVVGVTNRVGFDPFHVGTVMAVLPICALAVAVAVGVVERQGPVSRLFRLLGDASYSIYLVHPIVISGLLGMLGGRVHYPVPVLIAVTLAAIGGGVICHLWAERPLVGWVNGLGRRRMSMASPV